MTDFADNLCMALVASEQATHAGAKILAILNAPDSPRRTRILDRLRRHAAAHLDLNQPLDSIDWSTIPWAQILMGLIKVFLVLLPLL